MSKTIKVDRALLATLIKKTTDGSIPYLMGGKVTSLDCDSNQVGKDRNGVMQGVDCSGLIRWLVHRITNGEVTMPDGSMGQRIWCQKQGFEKIAYKDCTKQGDKLVIAFMDPVGKEAGHVWVVTQSGETFESRGGKGPSRRKWNTAKLLNNVDYAFILTDDMS